MKTLTLTRLKLLLIQNPNNFLKKCLYFLFTNRCHLKNFDQNGNIIDFKITKPIFEDLKFEYELYSFFKKNNDILISFKDDILFKIYFKKYEIYDFFKLILK